MRATFQNRLSIVKPPFKEQRVCYDHNRRIDIDIYFDFTPKKESDKMLGQDWTISMEGKKETIATMRERLGSEVIEYVMRRSNLPLKKVPFTQLLEMAECKSIS